MATISETSLSTATPTFATTSSGALGKDDFLKLLVEQLKNQDPMNPLQGTEFATQLAQFSSVEQLSNINTALEANTSTVSLMAQSMGNSLATTMIGKEIKATGDTLKFDGKTPVNFGYTLPSNAETVTVRIYNEDGDLIEEINGAPKLKGNNAMSWDGKEGVLDAGKYTFKVDAKDADGKSLTTSSYTYGKIAGVRFTSSGTMFVVDGIEVPVANILEIIQGAGNG